MKNMLLLTIVLMMVTKTVIASTEEEAMEANLKSDPRRILVKNDEPLPIEVNRSQYGARVFCYNKNRKTFSIYQVDEDMLQGSFTAHLVCVDGELYMMKGWL
jgi:hypothetical protein